MPPKSWKDVERRVARFLGGERNPLSGGASRHTRGDVLLSSPVYVEVKHGASVPRSSAALARLFLTVEGNARDEGKLPVLVLHPKGKPGVGDYPSVVRVYGGRLRMDSDGSGPWPKEGVIVSVPLSVLNTLIQTGGP